jgi:RNA polymerase sigma factor (sigma-70 family)
MTIGPEPSDAELIRRARGDADAFAELYVRHVARVHGLVRGRVHPALELEIVAESFAQAAVSLHRYRDPGTGSAAPWLCGIALNLLRRAHARQRVETSARARLGMPLRDLELDVDAIAERLDAHAARALLRSALADLPSGQRDAIELRIVRELEYDDVARELGTTVVAARIRVMRALRSLAHALKGVVA